MSIVNRHLGIQINEDNSLNPRDAGKIGKKKMDFGDGWKEKYDLCVYLSRSGKQSQGWFVSYLTLSVNFTDKKGFWTGELIR